jgi:hypothetical protein
MAKIQNLVIDQGTTFLEYITYVDNSKLPIDITGYLARGQMRKSHQSANSYTFLANVVSAATGNISLEMTSDYTTNIKYGRYVYDVEIYSNANIVHRVVEGIVTVNPEVTK